MARFDKFMADQNTPPKTNGHAVEVKAGTSGSPEATGPLTSLSPIPTRKHESVEAEESSELLGAAPPKKMRKRSPVNEDAVFAARLQAEENNRARPTRGGVIKKTTAPVKKKKTSKNKTADRVAAADDSDLDSEAAEKKVNRTGGFHVNNNIQKAQTKLTQCRNS